MIWSAICTAEDALLVILLLLSRSPRMYVHLEVLYSIVFHSVSNE